ncbi:(S)-N-methylcoclaurine 3'-hydroxylase isozyme 1 [Sesamum alatum]|uniref:(S)-N-methylcoclaurine 3'-hydroxylase isozyme 1 n=1 Tax=Sesamum alatum TaxID=300844 RepID=A0AAE2CVU5_9LAMI|nr:(S)-N-methylcoclaurine 3'-hydroxylase isozyme 1 [Sesamum alatum]
MDSRSAVNHENVSNFTFLCLIFVLLFMIMKCIERGASPAIPPGPFPWPVIGNFLQVGENPHIKLFRMARTYGPIMSLSVSARLVVVGSSAMAAMEMLKTNDRVLFRVMDYIIPKGSQVIINTWAMACYPSVGDDPSSFIPDQFLDSSFDFKGNDFEYVPVGSGQRMCPKWPMDARKVPYIVASLMIH